MSAITIISDLATKSFTINLNGLSADRDKARIKLSSIRSLVKRTDNLTVEVIFTSGEIYGFPYIAVESVDSVSVINQDDLYNKMEAIIFVI